MSYIENYRDGDVCRQREMWNSEDIAEYCGIRLEKAEMVISVANQACGGVGYADIPKNDFIEFYKEVERNLESLRLQDETNAASIVYAQKNYSLNLRLPLINQALSLLSNL